MNEEGSDISFKVQNKVIPAHKQILMKRSPYFENLFNSTFNLILSYQFSPLSGGMAESRQDVIEINDCEFDVFKGLQFFLISLIY